MLVLSSVLREAVEDWSIPSKTVGVAIVKRNPLTASSKVNK